MRARITDEDRRFENWIDLANRALWPKAYLSQDNIETISHLATTNDEARFESFLNGLCSEHNPGELAFRVRPEPIKWAREVFAGGLLTASDPIARLTRIKVIETLRRPLNIVLAVIPWGSILAAAFVWLGAPSRTGLILTACLFACLLVYLLTLSVRSVKRVAAEAFSVSLLSGTLQRFTSPERVGRRVETITLGNKALEIWWGIGFIVLIPLLCLFLGWVMGVSLGVAALAVALTFFAFGAKTNLWAFKSVIDRERELLDSRQNEILWH